MIFRKALWRKAFWAWISKMSSRKNAADFRWFSRFILEFFRKPCMSEKQKKQKTLENTGFFKGLWRRVWDSNPRGVWAPNGFQDRLVMTASITLRVDYLIVLFLRFFLAFRILDRDHFGQVFYRLEKGVFWTSFGGRRLASSRGRLKFQDRLVMTTSWFIGEADTTLYAILFNTKVFYHKLNRMSIHFSKKVPLL